MEGGGVAHRTGRMAVRMRRKEFPMLELAKAAGRAEGPIDGDALVGDRSQNQIVEPVAVDVSHEGVEGEGAYCLFPDPANPAQRAVFIHEAVCDGRAEPVLASLADHHFGHPHEVFALDGASEVGVALEDPDDVSAAIAIDVAGVDLPDDRMPL